MAAPAVRASVRWAAGDRRRFLARSFPLKRRSFDCLPALGVALALVVLLGIGQVAHPDLTTASDAGAGSGYAGQAAALVQRYDRSIAEENHLLAMHDANPGVGVSPGWLRQSAEVLSSLDAGYQEAQSLAVPSRAASLKSCLAEGYRLTSTGAHMLHDAYLTDGHGAYFLAAHGNWDLHLGAQRMATCRTLLDEPSGANAPSQPPERSP